MRLRWPLIALMALAGAQVAQLVIEYPKLPAYVASHFDGAGRANGWMERKSFAVGVAGLTGFMLLVFGGLALALPRFPNSLINLPNKDYWLSAERRADTLRYMGNWLLWQGFLTLGMLGLVFEAVYRANAGVPPRLDPRFSLMVVVFVGVTLARVGLLYFQFRRKPTR